MELALAPTTLWHPTLISAAIETWMMTPDNITSTVPDRDVADGRGIHPSADAADVEGLGSPEDEEGTPYPLRDMMVRTEARTVSEVVKRINRSRYVMNPGFQRDYVWDDKQASKLIESCVMRIPLPVLYVAEGLDGRITVVDGLQRLTAFTRFLNDDLKLTGLGVGHPLEGLRFSDLSIDLRERVEDTQLTLYILDRSTPPRARLDIFDRVNSGAKLTRQQMRNALYYGPGTEWLARMALERSFLRVTAGTLSRKIMRDREVINRFAAFHLFGYESYTGGDMDGFLARAIEKMNEADEETLDSLRETFTASMGHNYDLFASHAFRKSLRERNSSARRTRINVSLFDVLSYACARIPARRIHRDGDEIRTGVYGLFDDEEFLDAITSGTNSTLRVFTRFEKMLVVLEGYWA